MDKNRLACSIQGLPHVGASCNFLYYLMFLCYCIIEIYSPTGRKRSGSPRDRLEYRAERLGLAERSLSHGREASLAGHGSSSSRSRDPRVDERVRRVSPEQLSRDRYRCDLSFAGFFGVVKMIELFSFVFGDVGD